MRRKFGSCRESSHGKARINYGVESTWQSRCDRSKETWFLSAENHRTLRSIGGLSVKLPSFTLKSPFSGKFKPRGLIDPISCAETMLDIARLFNNPRERKTYGSRSTFCRSLMAVFAKTLRSAGIPGSAPIAYFLDCLLCEVYAKTRRFPHDGRNQVATQSRTRNPDYVRVSVHQCRWHRTRDRHAR